MPGRRMLLICALTAGIVAVCVASLMIYIAFEHNPQGEFFDPESGAVQWTNTLTLFLSWAIAVALFIVIAEFIAWLLVRAATRFLLRERR